MKKDNLWVKWVHGRYLRGGDRWTYTPKSDTSWYWKKLLKVKERFRTYPKSEYIVKQGYRWLTQTYSNKKWTKLVWNRVSIPRHSLTAWLFMHQKLPVLHRIGRFTHLPFTECGMCYQSIETQEHLFFECHYAKDIWARFLSEWNVQIQLDGMETFISSLNHLKMLRKMRGLMYAGVNAVLYNIWLARNRRIFNSKDYHGQEFLKKIKTQITQRWLQLHQHRQNYTSCIVYLLHRV